jgi:hypothetical protein
LESKREYPICAQLLGKAELRLWLEERGKSRFGNYLVGLGVPALVFAVCFAMTGYLNFWGGIAGSAIAIGWFLVDWVTLSRGRSLASRATGIFAP